MVWPGDEVSKYISIRARGQIQPNGVDLTVGEIYVIKSEGVLSDKRRIPEYEEMYPDEDGFYNLSPGAYVVRYAERIRIPDNAIGLVFPRSSLQRMGAIICTSVWDSGYEGRGIGLLIVLNPFGIKIKKGERICQMIFIDARAFGEYSGRFQHEGLS